MLFVFCFGWGVSSVVYVLFRFLFASSRSHICYIFHTFLIMCLSSSPVLGQTITFDQHHSILNSLCGRKLVLPETGSLVLGPARVLVRLQNVLLTCLAVFVQVLSWLGRADPKFKQNPHRFVLILSAYIYIYI